MEETEDEEKLSQGVIKTVASPTVLAAILNESVEGKQAFDSSLDDKQCVHSIEVEKIPPLEMDCGQKEENVDDSFVADSLEYEERSTSQGNIDETQKHKSRSDSNLDNSSILDASEYNNTQDTTEDFKREGKLTKNKLNTKQKPRGRNFIDLNKERLNRTRERNSYASIYSQKLKQKHENPKQKQAKESEEKNDTSEGSQKQSNVNRHSQQNNYYSLQDRSSSLSDPSYGKGSYYNVDPMYLQNIYGLSSQNQPGIGYNDYLTHPYNAPYRDFGLRYSNYGHQSYMAASAVGANRQNIEQLQGHSSSQSAPTGAPRQPLLDQVEFFPEQENLLSQSLTNSQFINPPQLYKTDSMLERRFVSEPVLSSSTIPSDNAVANIDSTDTTPRKYLDYKPYSLKDYKQLRSDATDTFGGLGPDTDSNEYKEKISKLNKQREYAEMLRIDHAAKKKQWSNKPAVAAPPARQQQAEAKRQAAINYAKSIPKPKVSEPGQHKGINQVKPVEPDSNVPLIELLRMRHIQEKRQVETMKKELMSKTH